MTVDDILKSLCLLTSSKCEFCNCIWQGTCIPLCMIITNFSLLSFKMSKLKWKIHCHLKSKSKLAIFCQLFCQKCWRQQKLILIFSIFLYFWFPIIYFYSHAKFYYISHVKKFPESPCKIGVRGSRVRGSRVRGWKEC